METTARPLTVFWVSARLGATAVGAAMGIPLAMLVGRALSSILYGVKPADAASFLLAVTGVALVALVASAVPARRAASVEPLSALRVE